MGAVAGIGFTVSLFITELAFDTDTLQDNAKIGILIASVSVAIIGATIFLLANRRPLRSPRVDPVEPVEMHHHDHVQRTSARHHKTWRGGGR